MNLYYSPGACSVAVHIALRELGLPHGLRPVILADGEQHSAAYGEVNPRRRVPALEVDGAVLTEVPALLVFLHSCRPEAGLLPKPRAVELGRALEWLSWLSSTVHVTFAQYRRPERFLPEGADTAVLIEHGHALYEAALDEIEQRIVGPWALGPQFSAVDAYLLPFYLWGNRIGLAMSERRPRWTALMRALTARPAVREAIEIEGLPWDHLGGSGG